VAWLAEHWAIITTVVGFLVAGLKFAGQAKYAKVIEALIKAIEDANVDAVKQAAHTESVSNGTELTLDKLVQKITGG
jgi:hypothetical protein